jgi:hypothetical protein
VQKRIERAQPYRAREMIMGDPEVAQKIAHRSARVEHSRRITIQDERPVDCRTCGIEIMPEMCNRERAVS